MSKGNILPQVVAGLHWKELAPGVRLRAVHLDNLTVTFVEMDDGAKVAKHSHPHEQISYVARGTLRMNVEGKTHELGEGEVLAIPAGAAHEAVVISGPVFAIDSFSPRRDDYVF